MLTRMKWISFRIRCAWHFYFLSSMTVTQSWSYAGSMVSFFTDRFASDPDARESVLIEMSYWEE